MGRSIIPVYRVEYVYRGGAGTGRESWHGRATADRLTRWVQAHNDSLKAGGANVHLSERMGSMPLITAARIVHQQSGASVANYTMAPFEIV